MVQSSTGTLWWQMGLEAWPTLGQVWMGARTVGHHCRPALALGFKSTWSKWTTEFGMETQEKRRAFRIRDQKTVPLCLGAGSWPGLYLVFAFRWLQAGHELSGLPPTSPISFSSHQLIYTFIWLAGLQLRCLVLRPQFTTPLSLFPMLFTFIFLLFQWDFR